jgi:hypothetical protein
MLAAMPSKVVKSAAPPNAGKGRVKGVPNKVTKAVKEMVLAALDKAGGEDYLVEQAQKNPTAFLTLVGKVLPLQLTGEDGGPVKVSRIELVAPGHE